MILQNFKFYYSVSDVRDLVRDTIISVKSLLRFVDRKDISIFYTPPRSNKNATKMQRLCNVIKVDNFTEPFKIQQGTGRYGEKFHILFSLAENIIFLDSDTFITRDFRPDLQGDFEFAGRIAPNFYNIDQNIWAKMFHKENKPIIPMINSGLMVFKKFTHSYLANGIRRLMFKDLKRPDPTSYQKDQYALSLAVSDRKIKWLTSDIHSYTFRNEFNGAVLHGSIPRIGSDLNLILNRMKLRSMRFLI